MARVDLRVSFARIRPKRRSKKLTERRPSSATQTRGVTKKLSRPSLAPMKSCPTRRSVTSTTTMAKRDWNKGIFLLLTNARIAAKRKADQGG